MQRQKSSAPMNNHCNSSNNNNPPAQQNGFGGGGGGNAAVKKHGFANVFGQQNNNNHGNNIQQQQKAGDENVENVLVAPAVADGEKKTKKTTTKTTKTATNSTTTTTTMKTATAKAPRPPSTQHQLKVRTQQFTAPQYTDELFKVVNNKWDKEKNGDIRAGPEFNRLNEDENEIDVEGGDGTVLILRNFEKLVPDLRENLKEKGYVMPTLIQKAVIPIVLFKKDYDLVARALTGTGKTGAFLFPIINKLQIYKDKKNLAVAAAGNANNSSGIRSPKTEPYAIIVAPTRELAQQLGVAAKTFCRGTSLNTICTYGEVRVADTMREMNDGGCDILVSTVGRLWQFVEEEKIKLNNLMFLVLDEADKLINDKAQLQLILTVKEIANKKSKHAYQTLLFSATIEGCLQESVEALIRPGYFEVSVATRETLPPTVKQLFMIGNRAQRLEYLCKNVLKCKKWYRDMEKDVDGLTWCRLKAKILIFCNARRRTNWLAIKLSLKGYKAIPISGDRSQKLRQEALMKLETGECDILVSTNITSRGLNLPGVDLVINFEMPNTLQEFVHRTGRTGRAGNKGQAISMIDPDDGKLMVTLIPALIEEFKHAGQPAVSECLRKMSMGDGSIRMTNKTVTFADQQEEEEEEE